MRKEIYQNRQYVRKLLAGDATIHQAKALNKEASLILKESRKENMELRKLLKKPKP